MDLFSLIAIALIEGDISIWAFVVVGGVVAIIMHIRWLCAAHPEFGTDNPTQGQIFASQIPGGLVAVAAGIVASAVAPMMF